MDIQTKTVMRYALTPQILPRLRELFTTGFHYIPYFVALIYRMVRLLPHNHPYLHPDNMGKYGIRHVIAAASNNLVISRDNIDQIIVYIVVLTGIVMAFIQVVLLVFGIALQPAFATSTTVNDVFMFLQPTKIFELDGTDPGAQDIALMMLDMVFGVPGVFNSCIATTTDCITLSGQVMSQGGGTSALDGDLLNQRLFPSPAHVGLHALFQFYSLGLLIIAVLITMYFVITVIAETAQTGTAFGKRFNKVWAPIRLVTAIGLLIPIGYGLNSSQYIVLYAAKFGSNFASNAWSHFSYQLFGTVNLTQLLNQLPSAPSLNPNEPKRSGDTVNDLGLNQYLITAPNIPELKSLLQFLYSARVCAEGLEIERRKRNPGALANKPIQLHVIRGYGTSTDAGAYTLDDLTDISKKPSARKSHPIDDIGTYNSKTNNSYEKMIEWARGKHTLTIRIGYKDDTAQDQLGNIVPECGEISFNMIDPRFPATSDKFDANSLPHRGPEIIQRVYWFIIQHAWFNAFYRDIFGDHHAHAYYTYVDVTKDPAVQANLPSPIPAYEAKNLRQLAAFYESLLYKATWGTPMSGAPEEASQIDITKLTGIGDTTAIIEQEKDLMRSLGSRLQSRGWGGAALWYNKIAELNGFMASALYNTPTIIRYPRIMEYVAGKKAEIEPGTPAMERFNPITSTEANKKKIDFTSELEGQSALAMWYGFEIWNASDVYIYETGNVFETIVNGIFGTKGLYDLKANSGTHPLAQLTAVGRSLIEAATLNIFTAFSSPLLAILGSKAGASVMLKLGMTIGTMALTIGFVLYYVVPFLPFIYFFFALGGWIKGIFEAMVGAPLWALAHIRIDGNGLPGQAAMAGYFLIFEIFLRPILIIFGLVASMSIFSAMVNVMHDVWDVAVSNVAGSTDNGETNELIAAGASAIGIDLNGMSVSNWARSPIDDFFYTVMYAIVVYMIGMSSFKLIDLIPNNILRWMGQSISTFNDSREDAAQNLMGSAYTGGQQAIQGIGGSAEKMIGQVNQKVGS